MAARGRNGSHYMKGDQFMLNKNGERELAYVVTIDEIIPVEGADRVEVAKVGGWQVLVRKNQFQPGDLAVYFEIDSKVPEKEPFLFLASKNYRIRTQKYFKGTVISQGLLMSAEDFGWTVKRDETGAMTAIGSYKKGDFLTEELEVSYIEVEDNIRKDNSNGKFEKLKRKHPIIFGLPFMPWLFRKRWGKRLLLRYFGNEKDRAGWPEWVVKTDEERVQNMPWILKDKSEWIATEKIDGTSTTATLRRYGKDRCEFYLCSRNIVIRKKTDNTWYEFNAYVEMAEKYHFKEVLKELADRYNLEWVTLQGETYGASIQKRDYGMKERDFCGFNLIFSDQGRVDSVKAAGIMKEFGIPWVPILDEHFIMPDTVEELLTIATGKSVIDGGMREGLVFRSQDGLRSFKAVSNEFLLKYHA